MTLELDPDLPPYLRGDAGKLRQMLINLVGNAVRYTETGHVLLRADAQAVADDTADNPPVAMLYIVVEDSGPGIPQDQLDEIFDAFVQLDHAARWRGNGPWAGDFQIIDGDDGRGTGRGE